VFGEANQCAAQVCLVSKSEAEIVLKPSQKYFALFFATLQLCGNNKNPPRRKGAKEDKNN